MLAPLRLAEVIRVFPASPLRPAGFHRHAAAIAGHEAAQRKIVADVMPRRNLCAAMQLGLNPAKGFKRDNWLVMPLGQPDIPFRVVKIAGVKFPVQHIRYGLDAELVMNTEGKTKFLREDMQEWLLKLYPYSEKLGYQSYLQDLQSIIANGTSSLRQRACFEKTQSLEDVVQHNIREYSTGKPDWNTEKHKAKIG